MLANGLRGPRVMSGAEPVLPRGVDKSLTRCQTEESLAQHSLKGNHVKAPNAPSGTGNLPGIKRRGQFQGIFWCTLKKTLDKAQELKAPFFRGKNSKQ